MKRILELQIFKKLIGFSFVGISVTIFSMLLTFVLIKIIGLSAYLTYIISFSSTISISYFLNSRLVFKSKKTFSNLVLYYGIYSVSLLIGITTLWIYRQLLDWDDLILNYMVIPVTMTWNFTISNHFLKKNV